MPTRNRCTRFATVSLDGASARTTVARIAAAVLPKGKDRRRIDPRFFALRDWFFEEFEGRIDVDLLGESVGVSGDHLRQIFRSQVGMTLSSYASWVRLYQTACAATHSAAENRKVNASRLLSEVGFYDASHASKVMRRYLDLKPTEMLEPKSLSIAVRGSQLPHLAGTGCTQPYVERCTAVSS